MLGSKGSLCGSHILPKKATPRVIIKSQRGLGPRPIPTCFAKYIHPSASSFEKRSHAIIKADMVPALMKASPLKPGARCLPSSILGYQRVARAYAVPHDVCHLPIIKKCDPPLSNDCILSLFSWRHTRLAYAASSSPPGADSLVIGPYAALMLSPSCKNAMFSFHA